MFESEARGLGTFEIANVQAVPKVERISAKTTKFCPRKQASRVINHRY
jgi:hypothetical protein